MGTRFPGRAVSPVVGAVLMVVLTVLLAGTFTFAIHLDTNEDLADDVASGDLGSGDDDDGLQDGLVVAENDTAGASDIVHATDIEVDEAAGTTLESITIEYPKDDVDLSTQQHEDVIEIGVDTDGDGEYEHTFDENDVAGVNTNNDNSELTISFDTGFTLSEGDRVTVRYEGADNPDDAGEYDVTVTLNDVQTETGTLVVE